MKLLFNFLENNRNQFFVFFVLYDSCFSPLEHNLIVYKIFDYIFVFFFFIYVCGSFLDGAKAQVETSTLGLLVVVLKDWAWFTIVKLADYKLDGAQNMNPTTHTC